LLLAVVIVGAGCATDAPTADPCAELPVVAGGEVQLLGTDSVPLMDGQSLTAVPGSQYFWTLVMTLRARDLHVGNGALHGVLHFAVFDTSNKLVSLPTGCRVKDFQTTSDGYLQLDDPFALPFDPAFDTQIEGAVLHVRVDVLDVDGVKGTGEAVVVSHFPSAQP
jgi:hypothetical protein